MIEQNELSSEKLQQAVLLRRLVSVRAFERSTGFLDVRLEISLGE